MPALAAARVAHARLSALASVLAGALVSRSPAALPDPTGGRCRAQRRSGSVRGYCHLKNLAAIVKQPTSHAIRTTKQSQSGEKGVPSTMT